eukprot:TRINITY_DN6752_c1_g1_i1.p1 TRINITY_DN6752_c1_g1~~TRINITY_DN6752_c1_g1_i1.p1  ORF type:complete len:118 (+),score=31.53 TRINITY_DN6752_c1_g1_i1:31-384(+)
MEFDGSVLCDILIACWREMRSPIRIESPSEMMKRRVRRDDFVESVEELVSEPNDDEMYAIEMSRQKNIKTGTVINHWLSKLFRFETNQSDVSSRIDEAAFLEDIDNNLKPQKNSGFE